MPPTEPIAEAVPPPPPTPQAELEQLLTDAQQQMDNRRFTAPSSGNALSTYRRILELQPDHPAALEGIQRITAYYQDIAQQSLRQGRLDESLAYINRGLRATPKNDALLSLRRQVQQAQKAARQREREEQQKRAALEEMQRQQLEPIQREQPRRQQEQQLPWWRQPPPPNESGGFNQR
jgi:tetratricopeptide (TPR) repeat protein